MDEQRLFNPDEEKAFERAKSLKIMKQRIDTALSNEETRAKVSEDFVYTFERLGLSPAKAGELCTRIFASLSESKPLLEIEAETLQLFENTIVEDADGEHNLVEILHEKLRDRAKLIASQVSPHLQEIKGKILDYGAGDGQVTQLLHDETSLDIEGVDVRFYPAENVTVPIQLFNGSYVDVPDATYEAALLTNVLHHERNNENILKELDRIVKERLVILETVPVGESEDEMEEDKDRTFMNDFLYNRLFHNADVPVPGTFETPQGWINRFAQHGWQAVHEQDLGFDQPTIKDRHYLLVFEKPKSPSSP